MLIWLPGKISLSSQHFNSSPCYGLLTFKDYSLFFSLSKSLSLVGFSSSFRAKTENIDCYQFLGKETTCLTPAGKKWKATAMEATRPSPVAPLLPKAISQGSEIAFPPDHIWVGGVSHRQNDYNIKIYGFKVYKRRSSFPLCHLTIQGQNRPCPQLLKSWHCLFFCEEACNTLLLFGSWSNNLLLLSCRGFFRCLEIKIRIKKLLSSLS